MVPGRFQSSAETYRFPAIEEWKEKTRAIVDLLDTFWYKLFVTLIYCLYNF